MSVGEGAHDGRDKTICIEGNEHARGTSLRVEVNPVHIIEGDH